MVSHYIPPAVKQVVLWMVQQGLDYHIIRHTGKVCQKKVCDGRPQILDTLDANVSTRHCFSML